MPFLTALAPQAKVRGSRDPLGLLPIWSAVGRRLIGNVTTVSGDLRGWTLLVVTVGIVERLAREGHIEARALDQVRPAFFRAEQLLGYACELNQVQATPRGVTGIRRRLREAQEGDGAVSLGTGRDQRILTHQASAGVWGQVLSSARESGLIHPDRLALLPPARDLWDAVWRPAMDREWTTIRRLVMGETPLQPEGHAGLLAALAAFFGPVLHPTEVQVYQDHILHGAKGVDGLQARLVALWLQGSHTSIGASQGLSGLRTTAHQARKEGHTDLADALATIADTELLLGPAERLFTWLRTRHGVPIAEVVDGIASSWPKGLAHVERSPAELLEALARTAYGPTAATALMGLRESLRVGTAPETLAQCMALNAAVMRSRRGAPWIRVEGDRLKVVYSADKAELPSPEVAQTQLLHSYYVAPLHGLVTAWEAGRHA